ncbi:hypothetical protein BH09PSE4_BH09PSE4_12680 [soil metagenome]
MKARILVLALALAGCGSVKELKPAAGEPLPPRPYGAAAQPTPTELLTPSTQARPRRADELLTQSQKRPDDAFDLPPP